MGLSVAAWIAIGAAVVAAVALALGAYLLRQIKRLRSGQEVLLGGGTGDLVDFAVSLQGRIDDLHRAVDEVAAGLARAGPPRHSSPSQTSIAPYGAPRGAGGRPS